MSNKNHSSFEFSGINKKRDAGRERDRGTQHKRDVRRDSSSSGSDSDMENILKSIHFYKKEVREDAEVKGEKLPTAQKEKNRDTRRDVAGKAGRSARLERNGIEIKKSKEVDERTGETRSVYSYKIGDKQVKAWKEGKVLIEDYEQKGRRGRTETIGRANDPDRVTVRVKDAGNGKYLIDKTKNRASEASDKSDKSDNDKLRRGREWYLTERAKDWIGEREKKHAEALEEERKKKLER